MVNILQIDLEEWYSDLDPKDWHKYEMRAAAPTERILSILEETGNRATFFVLGYIAERIPELIRKIDGHPGSYYRQKAEGIQGAPVHRAQGDGLDNRHPRKTGVRV